MTAAAIRHEITRLGGLPIWALSVWAEGGERPVAALGRVQQVEGGFAFVPAKEALLGSIERATGLLVERRPAHVMRTVDEARDDGLARVVAP